MFKLIDRFKLDIMLSMVPVLLRRAMADGKPERTRLRELLREPPFVFQIRTRDGAGGWFELRDGALRFHRGTHASPDLAQTWRSAADAVFVLGSRDESLMLRSLENGRCRLNGRFAVALWFNELMKLCRPGRG